MQIQNAIRKLEKAGFANSSIIGNTYSFSKGQRVVSFIANPDRPVQCIKVHNSHDRDDFTRNYSAGTYVDNVAQAIRLAQ